MDLTRVTKCGISLLVFVCSNLRSRFLRLRGRRVKGTLVILYYHSIPQAQRERFARQLDVVLRHATPVDVGGQLSITSGQHYAGITFDDGFEDFAIVAVPELAKRKIPSTVFVISDALGKAFGPHGRPERVISVEQLRALPQDLVTIGSHTSTHPFLPLLSEQSAEVEICRSRTDIEATLKRDVLLFSFPFGGFNERLIEQCRKVGYQRVFTTLPRLVFEDSFAMGRVRVDPDDTPLEFRLKLAGAYRWLPIAFSVKRKLRSLFYLVGSGRTRSAGFVTGHSVIQDPSN
jgi:peptidoglycan/xylan/chitin deacetylase (PgdA/CDA1 family)